MRAARKLRALFFACASGLALGCNSATVRSGLPPASTAPHHHDRWHAAFLFGTLEASGPYSLGRLCPDGWSEITVGPDPFTVLAGVMTLFIYSPARVTIVCAAKSPGEPPSVHREGPNTSAESRQASPPPPPPESF